MLHDYMVCYHVVHAILSPRFTGPRFTSPRFTSPRFTSPRFHKSACLTSPRFTSPRFTSPAQSSSVFEIQFAWRNGCFRRVVVTGTAVIFHLVGGQDRQYVSPLNIIYNALS